jgi:hypothetical protein
MAFPLYAGEALNAERGGLFGTATPAQAFADAFGLKEPIEALAPAQESPADRAGERGFATPEILGVKAAVEGAQKVAAVVHSLRDDFRKVFNPAARGEEAKSAALMTREYAAQKQRRIDQVEAAVKQIRRFFAGRAAADNHYFIDRMEHAYAQGNSDLDEIARLFREILDVDRSEIQNLGTGKLEQVMDNYFPRYWEKGARSTPASATRAKRPLEGSKSFTKKRSYEFFMDGINNGEKPLSEKPGQWRRWHATNSSGSASGHRVRLSEKRWPES